MWEVHERVIKVTEHVKTRKKLIDIVDVSTFKQLVDTIILTSEEKAIIEQHYLQGKNFAYIADMLGYAESTVLKKHNKILQKFSKILK